VTICVVDTGVTPTPDLDIIARTSVLGGTPDDVHATPGRPGHGTVVAHFAAGKVNGWGSAGAFPHARIASVRVFPENGPAQWQDYIRALDRCPKMAESARVLVLALGGRGSEAELRELDSKITIMRRDFGFNVVAAAGNGGAEAELPGRFPDVFSLPQQRPRARSVPSARVGRTSTSPRPDVSSIRSDGTDHRGR
jgi:subtilisin family serine protease